METANNPDIPRERQMLHILRSYQHLQEEVLRLRAENSRLSMRLLVAKQALQHAAPPLPDTSGEKAKRAIAALPARDAEIRQLIDKLSLHLHGRDNRIHDLEAHQSKLHSRLSDAYAELRKVRADFKDYVLKHPHIPEPPQASHPSH